MLVLLPPSEGKADPPRRGAAVDLAALSFPELTPTRQRLLDALTTLCRDEPDRAAGVLELGPTLRHLVGVDAAAATSPTMPARRLYTGVLYAALGLLDLPPAAAARASRDLVIASGLWGLVRPGDRLPAYRLPGGLSLPGVGPLPRAWRPPLTAVGPALVGRGPVLDLRSGTYTATWSPTGELADVTVTVRVLSERVPSRGGSDRSVVAEANKAVKGQLTRALLLDDARLPASADRLVDTVTRLGENPPPGRGGWRTEDAGRTAGRPWRLDLVTSDFIAGT